MLINGVELTICPSAHLQDANLQGANLQDANLQGANLLYADLRYANLRDAHLQGAILWGAHLQDANLQGANLRGADLRYANLQDADLRYANLQDADLRYTNLPDAHLQDANLQGADLRGANLRGANLRGAYLPPYQIAAEGDIIGWKKVQGVLVKLRIPSTAARTSSLVGRKCRAVFAEVLWTAGNLPVQTRGVVYRRGRYVWSDSYDNDPRIECSHGIHFFITREEAEVY